MGSFLTLAACHTDQNSAGYCDERAQVLIDKASATNDRGSRHRLQSQAVNRIMGGYPLIPMSQYGTLRLVKLYVGSYTDDNVFDRYRGKDLYILKH